MNMTVRSIKFRVHTLIFGDCELRDKPTRRGKERRAMILKAALKCFRRDGFHGASIANICKEAAISPGHLYHFFPGKEAIIQAIVEEDRDRLKAVVARLAEQPDLIKALNQALGAIGSEFGFALDAVLSAEILAEATRNPRVLNILTRFDQDAREEIERLLNVGQNKGQIRADLNVQAMAGVMLLIADGLLARSISDPNFVRGQVNIQLQRMISTALSP